MGYEFIRVETDGHLLTLTIDRPQVRNALHPPACQEMAKAFDDFEADPDLWVAIVTGAGDAAFCAGNDLKHSARDGFDPTAFPSTGFGGLTHRFECAKPIFAAVNGLALGGGFELALACDLIVAAEGASFGLTEPRVGGIALGGGLHRLPRQIGHKTALGMILTGRRIDAEEARILGLVLEVVPGVELLGAARRWAGQILECAPLSVRASKQVVMGGLGRPLRDAMEATYPAIEELLRSEDFREGARAFAAKRKPDWRGR